MASRPLYRPATQVFVARGYKKQAGLAVFTKAMPSGLVVRVGMNSSSGVGLTLNPLLGVGYPVLSAWVGRLLGPSAPSDPLRWSVTTTLALLVPRDQRPWRVVEGEEEQNAQTWDLIGRQFDEYAVPWINERGTPGQLAEALRQEFGPMYRCDLPVLLWLLGDETAARAALEVERRRPFTGGTVIDYEAFAGRLLAEINRQPGGPKPPGGSF